MAFTWGEKIQVNMTDYGWTENSWLVDQYNKHIEYIQNLNRARKNLDKYIPNGVIYMSRRVIKDGKKIQENNVVFDMADIFTDQEISTLELCPEIDVEDLDVSDARKSLNEFAEIYANMTGREYILDIDRPDWSARLTSAKIKNKEYKRKEIEKATEIFFKNGGILKKFKGD